MMSATRGFRVGRIAGVEVRVDWSLLIVFWLIVMNLGGGLFPAHHPELVAPVQLGHGRRSRPCMFFLSVLAHELSHALVGRANGVPVAGITLFIFGGIAHMRGEPRSPRAELLMTVVGPLTSLLIGAVALWWGTHLAGPRSSTPPIRCARFRSVGPFATILLWLGPDQHHARRLQPDSRPSRSTAAASCAPRCGRRRAISRRRRAGRRGSARRSACC